MVAVQFIEPMQDEQAARAAEELYIKTFGKKPEGVWAAPGRVNLIGEHTDYNGGLCLPIALPHRTYVAMGRSDAGAYAMRVRTVSDVDPENVAEANLQGLEAGQVDGWSAYVVGVAWALRQMGYLDVQGFDAAFVSCVPLGSGLSSSAAMTCSTALALSDLAGLGLSDSDEGRIKLINAAIRAENEMAGASTGGLDQNASMRCAEGYAIRLDCRPGLSALESVSRVPVDLDARDLELLVLDTCAPHQLNDGQYAARRKTCEDAAAKLGVENLRVIADKMQGLDDQQRAQFMDGIFAQLDDETMIKRVRHVVTEIERVDQFINAFNKGEIERAGELLNASHDSLRDDYEVTVPELDVAVDVAREAGAYGARMTGGGFGGSIIALVDKGQAQPIAQRIADEFERRGFNAPRALPVVASAAAHRVSQ
ncbi:galactokinase [Bifidobacterium dolichotidis]|uniref:Galactokinase n=1 Tax=Bifidobacterium dolichotidis TaxID=2306976 RepID=A0A430FRS8_9BIFI|nr:galactokinase [Bifidobacterium dolichotidis]RSX55557.1 galactokinase [Bifidobacterium dolichotidis]